MNLAKLYADLADRAWAALVEVKARAAVTHDEDTGHTFHGNQWTGGLGAKPKTHTQKTSKAAVHELLSSGHPFTKQELMDIAGIKTEKLLSDYLAMLKNPKYAGPKGALSIQQKDGHYYVALPNGKPAPPLKEPDVNVPTDYPDFAAWHAAKLAHETAKTTGLPPDEPEPEKPAAAFGGPIPQVEPLTPAEQAVVSQPTSPYATAVMKLSGAHPGSMPKGEADVAYEQAMSAANVYLKGNISKAVNDEQMKAALLKWKNQKAAAMAAWASAVHGQVHVPKPQEYFKADKELGHYIALGGSLSAGITQWKANTAAEKMGNFPPKTIPTPTPASKAAATVATPPQVVADMGHPLPVTPIHYDALVPTDSTPIDAGDFASTNGTWSKGMTELRQDLEFSSNANAADNKKSVENKLRERLKDAPNFQALVKRLGLAKEGYGSLEAKLIAAWAGSSGDTHDISVAQQLAVRDAFSIPDSHIEKKALNSLNKHGHDEGKVISAGIQSLNENMQPLKPHEVQTAKHALIEFVQAQYHETQAYLASKGHDHVYLARGMKLPVKHANHEGAANLKLQPASSFSASYSTANQFSGGHGTVFLTKVPRQQVLSTYITGFGCTSEHEVVVLAHNKLKSFTVPSGLGQTAASSTVHTQVKGQAPAAPAPVAKPAAPAVPKTKKTAAALEKGDHYAALKTAVINAKSKAYKAGKVAFATKDPAKVAHATKAAEEAAAAVKALAEYKLGK